MCRNVAEDTWRRQSRERGNKAGWIGTWDIRGIVVVSEREHKRRLSGSKDVYHDRKAFSGRSQVFAVEVYLVVVVLM